MSAAVAGFAVRVGGAGFAVCWAVLMKMKDLAIWRWISGTGPVGVRVSPWEVIVAALGVVGGAQERSSRVRGFSVRIHANASRWLGERDPGSAVWLACKEIAFLLAAISSGWLLDSWLLGFTFGVAASFLPDALARDRFDRRQNLVRRELPDVLDLLALSFEAGLSLDGGLKQVCENYRGGVISAAVERMLQRVRFGARRHQAWKIMAAEIGNADFTEVTEALIQADTMGIGLADALKKLSSQGRVRRRQQIEEAAQKAPIKLLFPLAFLIFPALFIVLLGPVILNLMEVFG